MLTFFTIPKPFSGHFGVIQRNALRSWKQLGEVRIILMGNEAGVAETAAELGLEHQPVVARTDMGTPILSDLFALAEKTSADEYFNYINADILLLSDFLAGFKDLVRRKRRFLLVGQRWNFDLAHLLDFPEGWEPSLRQQVLAQGRLHGPTAIDYFVYRRGMWGQLPPFAVGRFSWDNWMIYRARQLLIPVVDATARIMCIHQNHDYSHGGGLKHVRHGPEARRNLALAGGMKGLYTLWDATHQLTPAGLKLRDPRHGLGGGIWSYRRSVSLAG